MFGPITMKAGSVMMKPSYLFCKLEVLGVNSFNRNVCAQDPSLHQMRQAGGRKEMEAHSPKKMSQDF